jgi:thiol-disulfide isomerase/thioredoxin
MINFWEPWCGPCIAEIGDLERLYEDYSDKGFQIIGVYSEQTMENEVDEILRENNVSYPVLHYTSEFDRFQSGYVPTTVFVDRQGKVLAMSDGTGCIIGSNTYSDWAAIIENLI